MKTAVYCLSWLHKRCLSYNARCNVFIPWCLLSYPRAGVLVITSTIFRYKYWILRIISQFSTRHLQHIRFPSDTSSSLTVHWYAICLVAKFRRCAAWLLVSARTRNTLHDSSSKRWHGIIWNNLRTSYGKLRCFLSTRGVITLFLSNVSEENVVSHISQQSIVLLNLTTKN